MNKLVRNIQFPNRTNDVPGTPGKRKIPRQPVLSTIGGFFSRKGYRRLPKIRLTIKITMHAPIRSKTSAITNPPLMPSF